MEEQLFVGFDRQEVPPDESIPLGGYGNEPKRFHTSVPRPICVTCVAISDASDTTVLAVAVDAVNISAYMAGEGLERVSRETGIPKEQIYLSASHTHAAASFYVTDQFPCAARYEEKFCSKIIEACRNALQDRKAASMSVGSIETKNMNFIKHYTALDQDTGELCVIGDQFGDSRNVILLDHATVVDPTMHVVKFDRPGALPIVAANFRAHPHFDGGYTKYMLSSDYIGPFRDTLEHMENCHAVYFQGACGNINASSRLPAERRFTTAVSYGIGLAAYAAECLEKRMTQVPVGPIRTRHLELLGPINRPDPAMLEKARTILELWESTYDRKKCEEVGAPIGIRSPYHAKSILTNDKMPPEDGKMILNAVAIGDHFAFVTFPGEMFDSVSVRMEENSPFATTMMLGYCCHRIGYLPSAAGYKYTSYETDVTRFAPGTGEQVADTYVEMLRQLK